MYCCSSSRTTKSVVWFLVLNVCNEINERIKYYRGTTMPGKLQPTLIKYPTKYFQPLIYCLSTNCCFHSFPGGKSKFFPQTSLVQNATFRNLKLEISVVTHWDPCCDQQLKLYFEVVFLKLVVEFCVGKKKSHKMSIMGFVLSMIVLFVFFC